MIKIDKTIYKLDRLEYTPRKVVNNTTIGGNMGYRLYYKGGDQGEHTLFIVRGYNELIYDYIHEIVYNGWRDKQIDKILE